MRLGREACWVRLATARHGVLSTVHPERGVDAVPVVFAIDGDRILLPVDTVKAKQRTDLARLANLRADPRCALLVEHYDDDWSRLWWVRVHGRAAEVDPSPAAIALLAARYEPYRAPGAIARMAVLEAAAITGWTAT